MNRHMPPRFGYRALLIASAVAIVALTIHTAFGADPRPQDIAQQVDRHLAAVEFGPAIELASQVADPNLRAQLLTRVALRQAQHGRSAAAFQTVDQIADDSSRYAAYDQLRPALQSGSLGAGGGGTQADFDTLIDLITTTIAPNTWEDVAGQEGGSIQGFPTGVFVDSQGVMRRINDSAGPAQLTALWQQAQPAAAPSTDGSDPRHGAALRKVSLRRLERAVQHRWALSLGPTEDMQRLAGLERIDYLFVYPETHDLVIAGPADNWVRSREGRWVAQTSGRPVLELDDLVVVLRNALSGDGSFGCAITPTDENLAKTKQFLDQSSQRALPAGHEAAWVQRVRQQLGYQTVDVFGIDATTRAARVLVEADYRMKLVGIGLEPGTPGVRSYLDIAAEQSPESAPLEVLRWWFTLSDTPIPATDNRTAFDLTGQPLQLLSENEMLSRQGRRIHTGSSTDANAEFARSFTRQFEALAQKYEIYADLENIFDLAMVAAIIRHEELTDEVAWSPCFLMDREKYKVFTSPAPQTAPTAANYRLVGRRYLLAAVAGGVTFPGTAWFQDKAWRPADEYPIAERQAEAKPPEEQAATQWWWD